MTYLKKHILSISLIIFISSIIFGLSYINAEASTSMPGEDCYWCNMGTCTEQIGGTGWSECLPASEGGEYCALGGHDCRIIPVEN